ncbi:unnamed protein product [marine sediment metagenome]|uniref:Uncharacterized protein n=1 Tax=marine sediment metagenome TaxID=412755 RepID=X0XVH1_9ZZZZ
MTILPDTARIGAWHCQECGSPLISNGGVGSVCPNGHGKIHPKMPLATKRRNHAIVALDLKDIRSGDSRGFTVPGHDGRWEIFKAYQRVLDSMPNDVKPGNILALNGDKVVQLRLKK